MNENVAKGKKPQTLNLNSHVFTSPFKPRRRTLFFFQTLKITNQKFMSDRNMFHKLKNVIFFLKSRCIIYHLKGIEQCTTHINCTQLKEDMDLERNGF